MMTAYRDLELHIRNLGADGVTEVGMRSEEGGTKVCTTTFDIEQFIRTQHELSVRVGEYVRTHSTARSPGDQGNGPILGASNTAAELALSFGRSLYDSLPDDVRGTYTLLRQLAQQDATCKGARLLLKIDDPRLAQLPWEYLADEDGFLARSRATPVLRWPTGDYVSRTLMEPELRVLVVASNPSDAPVPKFDAEVAGLRQLFGDPSTRVNATFLYRGAEAPETHDPPTVKHFRNEILEAANRGKPFHVLHFIGHGTFDQLAGRGHLIFEDEDGRQAWVSGEQMEWEAGDNRWKLVVLNACHGARTSNADEMSGVAVELLRRNVAAVVAMQFAITGEAASAFSIQFYQALLKGSSIDAAVGEGRRAVRDDLGEKSIEWGTPALFVRYEDGRLVDVHRPLVHVDPSGSPPPEDGATSDGVVITVVIIVFVLFVIALGWMLMLQL